MKFSAPARIDLAGGTLDVPPLCFLVEHAKTLNLAIDLRVTIEATREWEGVALDEGKPQPFASMPLYEKAFAYFGAPEALGLRVTSDIPRASGLGGSSSLLVALVNLVQSLENDHSFDRHKVLKWVTVLEHRLLGKPAGTQDAIGAIHGGLSSISYELGMPTRQALPVPAFLTERPLILAYSPIQHHSGINNWAVVKAACEGEARTLRTLHALADNAHDLESVLLSGDARDFFACMQREAALRQELCPQILTEDMAAFATRFKDVLACKACGAGGGGCMLAYGPDYDLDEIKSTALENNLQIFEVKPDMRGCERVDP